MMHLHARTSQPTSYPQYASFVKFADVHFVHLPSDQDHRIVTAPKCVSEPIIRNENSTHLLIELKQMQSRVPGGKVV